jgi:REP element-mobilizing transposase RayT
VHWIDLFTRKEYIHILINSLKYYQNKRGLIIHAFCIMPSHLHMVISSHAISESLGATLRDFKKYSNKKLIEEIHLINESRSEWLINAFRKAALKLRRIKSNKLWQDGNHPIELDNNTILDQKIFFSSKPSRS